MRVTEPKPQTRLNKVAMAFHYGRVMVDLEVVPFGSPEMDLLERKFIWSYGNRSILEPNSVYLAGVCTEFDLVAPGQEAPTYDAVFETDLGGERKVSFKRRP